MKRWDILNNIILLNNYTTYLEIGVDNFENYDKINCKNKECCDPLPVKNGITSESKFISEEQLQRVTYRMTSDKMFEQNTKKYDLIFIDGLHTKEQVSKDIKNSFEHLNVGGTIVLHDCLPNKEICQVVPRLCGEWNGDVWKVVPELLNQGFKLYTIDEDYGCCVIQYSDKKFEIPTTFKSEYRDVFLDKKVRDEIMNVVSIG